MTIAWIFPGQGSQKVGMADSVLELDGASERFELASKVLGRDLLQICSGKNQLPNQINDLNDTRNTQPAMFVVESLLVDALKKNGKQPSFVAGHSLGEIVALYAAEVFDLATALNLLKIRSELMAAAGEGAMTALLGFNRTTLEELVNATEDVVIANDNSADQVVLSGKKSSLDLVAERSESKRIIPLNVSGAFHSPFMEEASNCFSKELDKVSFKNAIYSVLSNSEPQPMQDGETLKKRLKKQMTSGVRWRETMQNLSLEGVSNFIEIGPGKVLSGLAKRSFKEITISQVFGANSLEY